MLNTLVKLGEQLSEGRSGWDDIIEIPETDDTDKKGNPINNYVLNIIFDLDNKDIIINNEELYKYDKEKSPFEHKLIKTQPARSGKIYMATLMSKMGHLKISLFGNESNNEKQGQFVNDIKNKFPELKNSEFYLALKSIYKLKSKNKLIDKDYIHKKLNLDKNKNRIIFCFISIVNSKLEINKPVELSNLSGYEEYINKKFFSKKELDRIIEKLCYVSGEINTDVNVADFHRGRNLNALFVKTTWNYASNFNNKDFSTNYQLSNKIATYLERASYHIIKNFNIRIAGLPHLIIPEFLNNQNIDLNYIFNAVSNKSEILFTLKEIEKFTINIEDEIDTSIYWINFIGYNSDGKYFKVINQIKDVSIFHFIKVITAFTKIGFELRSFISDKYIFNVYSVYQLIPVKSEKNQKKYSPYDIYKYFRTTKNRNKSNL